MSWASPKTCGNMPGCPQVNRCGTSSCAGNIPVCTIPINKVARDPAEDYTPARNKSLSARVARTEGTSNSVGSPGSHKVTGYGMRDSAVLQVDRRDLLIGSSSSIKEGHHAC